jgi:MYXO-CTERM domain-containing protein
VKQASYSPQPPDPFGLGDSLFRHVLGGPCSETLACSNDGPMKGHACADDKWLPVHEACDSAPGAGDGNCDACPVHGGVTTEDEMFILLGSYYMAPEPGGAALAAAALAAIGALARRRRRC